MHSTLESTVDLTKQLIARPSVTPEDAGCLEIVAERLKPLGFHIERIDKEGVSNLWATHGKDGPVFVFLGHTDVVPPGKLDAWDTVPFEPTIKDGLLYGRGAADMKGSVAAMITAVEEFIAQQPNHLGTLAFLLTSDEEGPGTHGVRHVVEIFKQRQQTIDYCLVGEPSSSVQVGDVVKNGRRGSLTGYLTVKGQQGHAAYPHLAQNAIHLGLPFLKELSEFEWDKGNTFFPATRLQIVRIESGVADNVIPGECRVTFNLRYSSELTHETIQAKVTEILKKHQVSYDLKWHHSGLPFITTTGKLLEVAQQAIAAVADITPKLSTDGGTSDGRFIAPMGAQVIELGPCNATIHKINEHVRVDDLKLLHKMYLEILKGIF